MRKCSLKAGFRPSSQDTPLDIDSGQVTENVTNEGSNFPSRALVPKDAGETRASLPSVARKEHECDAAEAPAHDAAQAVRRSRDDPMERAPQCVPKVPRELLFPAFALPWWNGRIQTSLCQVVTHDLKELEPDTQSESRSLQGQVGTS